MLNIRRELGDVRQMPRLAWRLLRRATESAAKGLMVCPNGEVAAFYNVAEVLDSQEDAEKFAIKSTIFHLGRRELLGEEGDGGSAGSAVRENRPDRDQGGIRGQGERRRGVGMSQLDCRTQGILGGDECSILSRRPCLLYTSPSPRDLSTSRMPSSA